MKKIKRRLFWSYDVLKTEAWLNQMSKQGYELQSVNFFRRLFVFEKSEPVGSEFYITYDASAQALPQNIQDNSAFTSICQYKNYTILRKNNEQTEYYPSHEGVLEKNQKIKTVVGIILLIQIVNILLPLTLIAFMMLFAEDFTFTVVSNELMIGEWPHFSVIVGLLLIVVFYPLSLLVPVWLVYTYFKLGRSNKALIKETYGDIEVNAVHTFASPLTKKTKKQLKAMDGYKKKIKLGWFYSPDKTEQWLEMMEQKGLNLVNTNKIGNTFHFIQGKRKNVKYHVDYQSKQNLDYYNINKESGWKLIFTSSSGSLGAAFSLWAQEYSDEVPSFYTDRETRIKHAKNLTLRTSIWLIPFSVMYGYFIIQRINALQDPHSTISDYIFIGVFTLVALEFSLLALRIIRYYFRVKRANES